MDISNKLEEIIALLKATTLSDYIACISLIISIIALITNIITNIKNHKQYIESLKPLLSFDFFEMNGVLLLSIKNMGQTEAKNIRIEISELKNNGKYNNLHLDDLFKNEFMLYPTEEVQGMVGFFGANIEENVFPVIDVKVSYLNGNDNKDIKYSRTISFKKIIYGRNPLSKIENSIESISYSNNRLANYIEGRTLFTFDKLNVFPNNSLYKDMKDAINNVEREKEENNTEEESNNEKSTETTKS